MNSAGETAAAAAYRAKSASDHLAGYAKEHPIRIAVTIGAGALAWWMLRGRARSGNQIGALETSWDDAEEMVSEGGPAVRSRGREYAANAKERVGQYASSARGTVSGYAQSARSGARRATASARGAAGTATTSVDTWVHENPLAAGAIALAVGAAIGLSAPATRIENRAMGETRNRAWELASQAAADLKENVLRSTTEPLGNA